MSKKVSNILKLATLPIVLYVFFSIAAPGFGLHSLAIVVSQSMIPTMMGLGLFLMMEVGIMDLSMGARTIFAAIIGGILAQRFGTMGLIVGCIIGGMAAALSMAIIYRVMRIPGMVVSLGIILIFEVLGAKLAGFSGYMRISESQYIIGTYPINILLVLTAAVFAYFLCYRTEIGCHIIAVGNDEKMCKNVGINADRVKFIAIVLTGIFGSLAGLLYICYAGSITATTEMASLSMTFKPIMCVILGRYLKKYFDCMPLLIFIGGVSITIIFNGFIAMGFSDAIQDIVLGLFLMIILGFESIKKDMCKVRRAGAYQS